MSDAIDKRFTPFSPLLFIIIILSTFAAFYAVSRALFPGFTAAQFASTRELLIVALVAHFCGGFFEFFFHRYVLHAPLVPGLSHFYLRHEYHHWLTVVNKHRIASNLMEVRVRNVYPIEKERQHEASFFPWYALGAFLMTISPVLLVVQYLLPSLPIVWGGYLGATFSMCLYELVHMMEHWPLRRFRFVFGSPHLRQLWRRLYSFHLRHHADKQSNEAISGFFGLPVPDIVFGTLRMPKTLYPHGSIVFLTEFDSPRPVFFIRWLDKLAERSRTRYDTAHPGRNVAHG